MFQKSTRIDLTSTCIYSLYHVLIHETLIIFLISKLNTASSKILSLCQSSLNGINWTVKFKMLLALSVWDLPQATFSCQNLKGIKYLTRLRLGLSHLHKHKFKNNFQNTSNPFCICGCDIENTRHFSSKITDDGSNILNQADASITKTLLFCNSNYSNRVNSQILNASIDIILRSKRFDELNKCLCLSVSLIKTICQFEYKVRVIFILIFTSISDCFSFPLLRYWKHNTSVIR